MKGRPKKYDTRLKPNGLTPELDDWYEQQAKKLKITRTELKRRVLSAFQARVEAGDTLILIDLGQVAK